MSIEDAINRLASAVQQQGEAPAVAEIIRQRNKAQSERDYEKGYHEYWLKRYQETNRELEHERRVIRGLRSAIKRMKAQRMVNRGE